MFGLHFGGQDDLVCLDLLLVKFVRRFKRQRRPKPGGSKEVVVVGVRRGGGGGREVLGPGEEGGEAAQKNGDG